jgi:hypothetical protein
MSAVTRPRSTSCGTAHVVRTCIQTVTNNATANAEQACDIGGATYM